MIRKTARYLLNAAAIVLLLVFLSFHGSGSGGEAGQFVFNMGQPDPWLEWDSRAGVEFSFARWSFAAGVLAILAVEASRRVKQGEKSRETEQDQP